MYLKKLALKNIGPIDEIAISLPFSGDGLPKPLILVGQNGTGKTIFQAQLLDALYEIGGAVFEDIRKQEGIGYQYIKVSGEINLKNGQPNGFSALAFEDSANRKIEYLDKINNITLDEIQSLLSDFSLGPSGRDGNEKKISYISDPQKTDIQNEWYSGAYFYQPAYRYEDPFWK
ncbi:MAG: hypothetical protein AAB874_02310, partial [Patescibacteria group bacterium]